MEYICQCVIHSILHSYIDTAAAETKRTDDTTISKGVRNGDGLPFAKICLGVLAYSLILSEMLRIALSPIAFVGVCPCVCVFVRMYASLLNCMKTV